MEWPTAKARTGSSRRDVRGRLLGSALAFAAVLAGLALLAVDRFAPERFVWLRSAAVDATAPVWRIAADPIDAVAGAWEEVRFYPDAIARARQLEGRLKVANATAIRAELLATENRRLKHLLGFVEAGQRRIAVARIAGASTGGLIETAVIGAGSHQGVRAGQPVRTDAGLIGRVVEVGREASRVLLVSDNESRVPVRLTRSGVAALLAGVGGGMAELRFVAGAPDAGPRVGDLVVTSGEGGLFAPDVPVARIVAVKGDVARAQPLARPETLGLAVIESTWLPAPSPAAVVPAGAAAKQPVQMAAMVNP